MTPYPTTVGTAFLGDRQLATADAFVVGRLRAAGALLLGKTNMHEIGHLASPAINPFTARRAIHMIAIITAVGALQARPAVAAGFCPVAIGADGGGSIRIPGCFLRAGRPETDLRPRQRTWRCAAVERCPSGPAGSDGDRRSPALCVRMAGPDREDVRNVGTQPALTLAGWDRLDFDARENRRLSALVLLRQRRHGGQAADSMLAHLTSLGATAGNCHSRFRNGSCRAHNHHRR